MRTPRPAAPRPLWFLAAAGALGAGVAHLAGRRATRATAPEAGRARLRADADPDTSEGGPLRQVVAPDEGVGAPSAPAPAEASAGSIGAGSAARPASGGDPALAAAAEAGAAQREHERRSPGSELGI